MVLGMDAMKTQEVDWKLVAWLAGLSGAVLLSVGCSSTPAVREYTVTRQSIQIGAERPDAIGERRVIVETWRPVERRDDRIYDINTQNWERPWPYGARVIR